MIKASHAKMFQMTNMLIHMTVIGNEKSMNKMLNCLKPTEKKTQKKGFSDDSGCIYYNNKLYNLLIHSKTCVSKNKYKLNITCPGRSDFHNPSVKMFDIKSIMKSFHFEILSIKCDNILITFQLENLTHSHIEYIKTLPNFFPSKEMTHSIKFKINDVDSVKNKLTVVLFYTQNPPKLNITGIKNYHNIDRNVQDCIHYLCKALNPLYNGM